MREDGSCWQFRGDIVSDDPLELRRAEEHAAECPACAEILRADHRILEAAAAWRNGTASPPEGLERRIGAALAAEPSDPARLRPSRLFRWTGRPVWRWAAAAAAVVLAVTLAFRAGAPENELERALREVEGAERAYAQAIAGLEREASLVLAKAGEPALDPGSAGVLLAYQDRLTHLGAVIGEVRDFLDENPGHSGGHTVLLAAYREKQQVLEEVLDLSIGDLS